MQVYTMKKSSQRGAGQKASVILWVGAGVHCPRSTTMTKEPFEQKRKESAFSESTLLIYTVY